MPGSKNIYESLLQQGYSKQEIDGAMHKYLLNKIALKKAYKKLSPAGKVLWRVKHFSWRAKWFLKVLTAKGLMLLKTQFAKKPKNPI